MAIITKTSNTATMLSISTSETVPCSLLPIGSVIFPPFGTGKNTNLVPFLTQKGG
jgi:hypothetical protein